MRWGCPHYVLRQEAENRQDEGPGSDASRPVSTTSADVPLPKGPTISQTIPAAEEKAFKHKHRRGHFTFKSQPLSKHTPPPHLASVNPPSPLSQHPPRDPSDG